MASAHPSRGGKLYKSLYEKLGKAIHEKQPEKVVKNEMLLHCCCNEKAKTPQTIDLQCLLLLVLVPRPNY